MPEREMGDAISLPLRHLNCILSGVLLGYTSISSLSGERTRVRKLRHGAHILQKARK